MNEIDHFNIFIFYSDDMTADVIFLEHGEYNLYGCNINLVL
jgi:hypothetical protein